MSVTAPRLARRARLRRDGARDRHVLLAPETVLALTPSAAEVLALCDGARSLDAVVAELAARHPGAPVARDVPALLARLAARGLVEDAVASAPERAASSSAAAPAAAASSPANAASLVPASSRAPDPAASGAAPSRADALEPPVALLAEVTYRCPLRCGYCSNPTDLARHRDELTAPEWQRVFREAAALGVLHLHLSGGEPLLRPDLADLVAAARGADLYTNLITSAYGLDAARLDALARAGLDHVQISFQHDDPARADAIAGTSAHAGKLAAARAVRERGLALSLNVVLHRGNIDRVPALIELASALGAERLELATTQYHGWALRNRDALLPSRDALEGAAAAVSDARARLGNSLAILYVLPDYYTDVPKPCMDGWGRRFVTVTPDGLALPCPGAHALPLPFDRVRERSLASIWYEGEAFAAYRGTGWMREPCASCERRDADHGGCRCQAFALTGDARNTDPACHKAPAHALVADARAAAHREPPPVQLRVRSSRNA